jgi:RNA polymerase sigma-70 factor (ECF subfamily)
VDLEEAVSRLPRKNSSQLRDLMEKKGTPSDSELVRMAKAGDGDAFGELVVRHEAKIYGLCLKMLGHPEDAEDCLQEVFMKAFEALPGFREEARFSTWLYRIAYNACLMRIRKKKLETVSLDRPINIGGEQVPREVADWTADPRAGVMSEELTSVLTQHINELEPDNRIVFVLRDIHGLSTDDTAKTLGLSVPAVKSRLHRARLYLRERLSGYFARGSSDTPV